MKLPWQEKDIVHPPNTEDISTTALNAGPLVLSSMGKNGASSVNEPPTHHPSPLLEPQVAMDEEEDESRRYLSGFKLYIIVFGLSISVLLVALVCTQELLKCFFFC